MSGVKKATKKGGGGFMRRKGFTLIELLIVISILGILAAAILPRFADFTLDARDSVTRANLASLRGAIVMYHGKNHAYPAGALTGLVPTFIERMPLEKASSSTGSNTITIAITNAAFDNVAIATSGWVYATGGTFHGRIRVGSPTSADGVGSTLGW